MPKHYQWKLKNRELNLGERTLLMGVLNVTPDSFSDGGKYLDPDRAFARALELEEQGADILDIGAESTRPGSRRISEAEELRRLIPVLKRLEGKLGIPVSVDTYKSGVADKALDYGVEIINDPTGILLDQALPKIVTKHNAGLILNHMRGTPETWAKLPPVRDLMRTIYIDLEAALNRARLANVPKQHIVIDPGIGFGKRREQNSEIIARLGLLRPLDLPIAIGPSRKSFLAKDGEGEIEFATAAAVAAAILAGAHIVRVHDMKAMKAVVETADAIQEVRERDQAEQDRLEAEKREQQARRTGRPGTVESEEDARRAKPVRPALKTAAAPRERPREDSQDR